MPSHDHPRFDDVEFEPRFPPEREERPQDEYDPYTDPNWGEREMLDALRMVEEAGKMIETTFTPGPWAAHKAQDNEGKTEGVWGSVKGAGYHLARIWNDAHGISAEAEANAHLIAAAPELYAALKEANAWISHGNGLSPGKLGAKCETLCDAEALIDAALAKAEGKATT